MRKLLIILILVFFSGIVLGYGSDKKPESWYVKKYCEGQIEVKLEDRTRCDCVTDTHAIEFDFAKKYTEAIGQSLHYARLTKKQAGIYLIVTSDKDMKYWENLKGAIEYHKLPITLIKLIREK